jgi:hypothetical protein
VDKIVQRVVSAGFVGCVEETGQTNFTDTIDKALRLQTRFNLGKTGDTFFRRARTTGPIALSKI